MNKRFAIDPQDFFQEIDMRLFVRSVWGVRWRIIQFAIFLSVVFSLIVFSIQWKHTIVATVRIEPELSTAGEKSHIDTETAVVISWPVVAKAADLDGAYAIVRYKNTTLSRLERFFGVKADSERTVFLRTLEIEKFDVPEGYLNKKFMLEYLDDGKYALFLPNGEKIIESEVGRVAENKNAQHSIVVKVSGIAAKNGDWFEIIPKSRPDYIEFLRGSLGSKREGIRNSNGVVTVTFRTKEIVFGRRFLKTLLNAYSSDALSRSIQGRMGLLDKIHAANQLVESQLKEAELALEAFRKTEGTVDIAKESYERIRLGTEIKGKIADLESERAELLSTRTNSHPSVVAIEDKISSYKKQLDDIAVMLNSAPELERKLLSLMRQVELHKQMYLDNTREINKLTNEVSGITGYVEILSPPIVERNALLPKLILAGLFGGMLAVTVSLVIILIRNAIFMAFIRSPDMLRIGAKMPVIASIPRSTTLKKGGGAESGYAKYIMHGGDPAALAIRSIEEKTKFVTHQAENNIILFTSDVEHQGKSFLASNFALFSSENRKTLLIDADIVNGQLHANFGVERTLGFSDLIIGDATLDEVLKKPMESQMSFIPAGTFVPSHNLLHDSERLHAIMSELSKQFDVIIVDYPAVMSQIEDPQMLSFAGTVFLVVRHGEAASRVKRFLVEYPQGLAKVSAIWLNDVT